MIQGIDYDSTYAPTIDFTVILIVLHIAATLGWEISGIDVGNAYLEAMSDRDNLIMRLPRDWVCFGLHQDFDPEYRRSCPDVYVRLAGNLYGTPQGALLWYELLVQTLFDGGFTRLGCQACCFIKRDNEHGCIILCVYVDDILIVTEKPSGMAWFKTCMPLARQPKLASTVAVMFWTRTLSSCEFKS